MVGRIAPWKGQHVFLAAFAEAFPDGGAEAVIVGSALFGEEAYEKELGRLVKDLGIVSGVRFSGFSDDVWEELSKLDVLVHASTVPEPFGQVVLEGMAAGLPVVAARAGGPAELITDGIDGLLFTPGQSDELATTLRVLAEDPLRRQELGQNARQRATSMTRRSFGCRGPRTLRACPRPGAVLDVRRMWDGGRLGRGTHLIRHRQHRHPFPPRSGRRGDRGSRRSCARPHEAPNP